MPLQGLDRHALTVEPYQVPTAKLEPAVGTISSVMNLHGQQKYSSGKADWSTLASGGSKPVV